ncbi:MAG: hypothetical protein IPI11_17365 [Haliscomenobacter sp.]|nr:hypothetical protein [Haliscomenobacter sp.]
MEKEKNEPHHFFTMPQIVQRAFPGMLQLSMYSRDFLFGKANNVRDIEILTEEEAQSPMAARALFYKAGSNALGVYLPKAGVGNFAVHSLISGFIQIQQPYWVPTLVGSSLLFDRAVILLPGIIR